MNRSGVKPAHRCRSAGASPAGSVTVYARRGAKTGTPMSSSGKTSTGIVGRAGTDDQRGQIAEQEIFTWSRAGVNTAYGTVAIASARCRILSSKRSRTRRGRWFPGIGPRRASHPSHDHRCFHPVPATSRVATHASAEGRTNVVQSRHMAAAGNVTRPSPAPGPRGRRRTTGCAAAPQRWPGPSRRSA